MSTALIVDDSGFARAMVRKGLQSLLPDHQILEAGSGEEAVKALDALEEALDYAFLDYNMPGMNGLELAQHIAENLPAVQMVLCTANIQDAIERRANEMGIRVLKKPFTEDKLSELLRSMGKAE